MTIWTTSVAGLLDSKCWHSQLPWLALLDIQILGQPLLLWDGVHLWWQLAAMGYSEQFVHH